MMATEPSTSIVDKLRIHLVDVISAAAKRQRPETAEALGMLNPGIFDDDLYTPTIQGLIAACRNGATYELDLCPNSDADPDHLPLYVATANLRYLQLKNFALSFDKGESVEEIRSRRLSDLANAERLRKHHGHDLRHIGGLGWRVWDDARWLLDEKAAVARSADMGSIVRAEYHEMLPRVDDEKKTELGKHFLRHAKASESIKGAKATLELASTLEGLNADRIEFDAHPHLFNTPHCTIDLRTGKPVDRKRDHYITKLCPTVYNPEAMAPRFMRFLGEIFEADVELIDFVQWAFGYGITGNTDYDLFFVLHGSGRNGKTTLMNAIMGAVGKDYSRQLNTEELMVHRGGRHSSGIAQLEGARLVSAQETSDGRELNTSLVKQLTGGDQISADLKYKDARVFVPQLKLFLSTNHRPEIKDDSLGMWARMILVPFNKTFAEDKQDAGLSQELESEHEGILRWLIEGARRSFAGKSKLPVKVRAATEEYREEQDAVGEFLNLNVDRINKGTVRIAAMFAAWDEFNPRSGYSQRTFGMELKRRGYEQGQANHQRVWKGAALKTQEMKNEEAEYAF